MSITLVKQLRTERKKNGNQRDFGFCQNDVMYNDASKFTPMTGGPKTSMVSYRTYSKDVLRFFFLALFVLFFFFSSCVFCFFLFFFLQARREHLEQREPFHRVEGRASVGKGGEGGGAVR